MVLKCCYSLYNINLFVYYNLLQQMRVYIGILYNSLHHGRVQNN